MAGGASQVEQTSFSEDDDGFAGFFEDELINLGFDVDALGASHDSIHVNFIVEMTNVSNNSIVLHLLHLFSHDDSLVTGGGDEDITSCEAVFKGEDLESFHGSLKSTDRINFGHEDDATAGTKSGGATLTDITVSADDGLLSGKHDISGTHDSIRKRMFASVQVIELGLGHGVVDIDGSEQKRSGLLHGVETVDTSGGLFRDTHASGGNRVPLISDTSFKNTLDDGKNNFEFSVISGSGIRKSSILKEQILSLLTLMDKKSHITTVIDDKIRSMAFAIISRPGDGVQGALPVFLKRFSLPGENCGRFITCDGSGSMILCGENVT
mmetsp:Transcript_1304/g.1747  ORF Transcript_1304/g.1747 Transcript_1304/m.1747 type:complete len:324 (+) Transcript_1304:301-1272(+)